MIKTVPYSRSTKTAGCAVTYRSGVRDVFNTCPNTCALKPGNVTGTGEIDHAYLSALRGAVPRGGQSFTYTHFDSCKFRRGIESRAFHNRAHTVINYSCDDLFALDQYFLPATVKWDPIVVTVPDDYFSDGKQYRDHHGVKVVNCPANHLRVDGRRVTCGGGVLPNGERTAACGNGRPLCARPARDYVIAFPSHGSSKRAAADPTRPGGCYAAGGNVRLHWNATRDQEVPAPADPKDGELLTEFARTLPRGSILRHHVAGDIGLDPFVLRY
jgi:hypothetical protein